LLQLGQYHKRTSHARGAPASVHVSVCLSVQTAQKKTKKYLSETGGLNFDNLILILTFKVKIDGSA